MLEMPVSRFVKEELTAPSEEVCFVNEVGGGLRDGRLGCARALTAWEIGVWGSVVYAMLVYTPPTIGESERGKRASRSANAVDGRGVEESSADDEGGGRESEALGAVATLVSQGQC